MMLPSARYLIAAFFFLLQNCVGERNQKYFLQFLVYVGVLSLYSVLLVVGSWLYPCQGVSCLNDLPAAQSRMWVSLIAIDFEYGIKTGSWFRLHTILLLLESSLFGLFVIVIMVDQMHAILYDETPVEALQFKGSYRSNSPKLMLLANVCGRAHPMCWLFPCSDVKRYDTPLLSHEVWSLERELSPIAHHIFNSIKLIIIIQPVNIFRW